MMGVTVALAATFNLICSGTEQTNRISGSESVPFNRTYRIDLNAGEYCVDECERRVKIARIDPVTITLGDSEESDATRSSTYLNEIDRRTGTQTIGETFEDPRDPITMYVRKTSAQCTLAPFGGWPSFKTKF